MLDATGSLFQEIGSLFAGSFWLLVAVLVILLGWTVVLLVRLRRVSRRPDVSPAPDRERAPSWVARVFGGFWWRPTLVVLGLLVWIAGSALAPGAGLEIVGPVILVAGVIAVGLAGRGRGSAG